MRKLICISAAALLLAGGICNAKQKPEMIVIDSPNLGKTDTTLVFSPRKATNTLILLHGRSGNYRNWPEKTDLQKICNETGFRIICPDGFRAGWYVDNPGGMKWRTFFWEELWPLLDKKYGLDPDRTFIDGLSMGGHGAMNIFLDHPERFRGAGSMSGVLNLSHSKTCGKDIAKANGGMLPNPDILREWSAVERLPYLKEVCGGKVREKVLLVSSGTEDRYAKTAAQFCDKCEELGYRHILMLSPGKHKWTVWVWTLKYHLDWFSQASDGGFLGSTEL